MCISSSDQPIKQIKWFIPVDLDGCPTILRKWAVKEKMIDGLRRAIIAHDTINVILDVYVPPLQHLFCVQPVHQH